MLREGNYDKQGLADDLFAIRDNDTQIVLYKPNHDIGSGNTGEEEVDRVIYPFDALREGNIRTTIRGSSDASDDDVPSEKAAASAHELSRSLTEWTIVTATADTTVATTGTDTHNRRFYICNASSDITMTINTPSTGTNPNLRFKNISSTHDVSLATQSTEQIDGTDTKSLDSDDFIDLIWDGSNWVSMFQSPIIHK